MLKFQLVQTTNTLTTIRYNLKISDFPVAQTIFKLVVPNATKK